MATQMQVDALYAPSSVVRDELYRVHPGPSTFRLSTTFNHDFLTADGIEPDCVLIAHDGVHFVVIAAKLRALSCNNFGSLLELPTGSPSSSSPTPSSSTSPTSASSSIVAVVPLSSAVLNILLHAVYGLSVAAYAPVTEDLRA